MAGLHLDLEDVVIALYAALDDALRTAGLPSVDGKLLPRPGPPPHVDDREVLCLALLQEIVGIASDHHFHYWVEGHPTLRALFPRRLSRQNFADRRTLLMPLYEKLCRAFCELDGEGAPLFSLSTPIPSKCAAPAVRGRVIRPASAAWPATATALR